MGLALTFSEVLFMQTRIIREAAQRWGLNRTKVLDIFKRGNVLEFIDECYEGLHLEGDGGIVDDIETYLKNSKIAIS